MDLGTLDTVGACNGGAEIELLHPVTQKPLGVFITVLGKDSDVFREHLRETIDDDIRRAAMAKKRGKQEEIMTVAKSDERGLELLVLCTQSWRTGDEAVISFKGENLTCTVANVKKLYEGLPWIRKQVDEAIGDLENFLKA